MLSSIDRAKLIEYSGTVQSASTDNFGVTREGFTNQSRSE